jgi:hypothetical protein
MILAALVFALLLAGAQPASADTGLGIRAWRWLVSVWAGTEMGPEIDPNGNHVQLPPPTATPPTTLDTSTSGGATALPGSGSGTLRAHTVRTQARSPR